jgi:hypothetical protein
MNKNITVFNNTLCIILKPKPVVSEWWESVMSMYQYRSFIADNDHLFVCQRYFLFNSILILYFSIKHKFNFDIIRLKLMKTR